MKKKIAKKKNAVVFRRGFFSNRTIPAEIAVQAIGQIEARLGRVTPQDVVEESRSVRSPLHPLFEWDDEKAGEAYRLMQARILIKSIVIERDVPGSDEPVSITVFHSASDEKGKAYFSMDRIAQDVDLFESASEQLRGQIGSLQRSVTSLNMIAPKIKKPIVKKLGTALKNIEDISEELGA